MSYLDYLTGYWASHDFRKKSHELKRKLSKITTMSSKDGNEFQWDENTAVEFAAYYSLKSSKETEFTIYKHLNEFKAFKAPSPVIEKKDWEIISCYNEGQHDVHDFIPNPDPKGSIPCGEIGCKIWSVRRVSDSVVFTVGDKISNSDGFFSEHKIEGFEINGDMLACIKNGYYQLKDISHAPIPQVREVLFTTEDGQNVYDDSQIIYGVANDFSIAIIRPTNHLTWEGYKFFCNKDRRDEYILLNKPCLNVQDVLELPNAGFVEKLKQLAKQKIDAKIQ